LIWPAAASLTTHGQRLSATTAVGDAAAGVQEAWAAASARPSRNSQASGFDFLLADAKELNRGLAVMVCKPHHPPPLLGVRDCVPVIGDDAGGRGLFVADPGKAARRTFPLC
jgi:hypothetical protein